MTSDDELQARGTIANFGEQWTSYSDTSGFRIETGLIVCNDFGHKVAEIGSALLPIIRIALERVIWTSRTSLITNGPAPTGRVVKPAPSAMWLLASRSKRDCWRR